MSIKFPFRIYFIMQWPLPLVFLDMAHSGFNLAHYTTSWGVTGEP